MNSAAEIRSFLLTDEEYLVVTHFFPDGDAIGSLLAFGSMLDQMNVRHLLAIDDTCPEKYSFLPGYSKIINLKTNPLDRVFSHMVILDAGALPRIGSAQNCIGRDTKILNIDHHFTGDYYGSINLIDIEASATAQLLYDLSKQLNLDIDLQIAYGLYVGILTDTGRFRFSNTNAKSLSICGELISHGVNPSFVTENIFYNMSFTVLKSLAWGLSKTELHFDGLLAVLYLDIENYTSETEGFVDFASSIKGVALAAFICEMEHNVFKVSLRSRCRVDVSEVARRLGGGGHRKAAGFRFAGNFAGLKSKLLSEIDKSIKTVNLRADEPLELMPPEDGGAFPDWMLPAVAKEL